MRVGGGLGRLAACLIVPCRRLEALSWRWQACGGGEHRAEQQVGVLARVPRVADGRGGSIRALSLTHLASELAHASRSTWPGSALSRSRPTRAWT